MSVVLNAVDLVFMIDGKIAPDTDEQDEHYKEKARRRRAGDRPIESGQSERAAGDLRQRRTHGRRTTRCRLLSRRRPSLRSGAGRASSAWAFQIHRTGKLQNQPSSVRRRNLHSVEAPVAKVQLLAGPPQSVCGNPSVGLPEPVPPLIKNASLASIMRVRSWAAPGASEPGATQSWSEKVGCAGTRREMQVPGDARQPSTACARLSSGSLASTKGTASAPPLPIPAR